MNFLLDPYVIAVPTAEQNPTVIQEYLFNLQSWAAEVTTCRHKFWLSESILCALWETGEYPLYDHIAGLEQCLDANDDKVFDTITLFRACEPILVEPPYLDNELKNGQSVLVDEDTIIVIPEAIADRLHPQVARALAQTLTQAGYAKEKTSHILASELLFATSPFDGQDDTICVQANVQRIDSEERLRIEADWPVVTDPSELDDIEGLQGFWWDTERAIKWAYQDLRKCRVIEQGHHELGTYLVGQDFIDSIRECHWDRHPDYLAKVYRTAVKVITGYWPRGIRENHELWISPNTSKQRTRHDGATAWRAHVTRGHLGMRLHYWLRTDGTIELWVVGTHND